MKDPQDPYRARYEQARTAFEELSIEERTLFLIKETINTIAAGVDDAVDKVSQEFETMFREAAGGDGATEAHEPEAPPKTRKTSTRKKSTSTKSTAKKTTSTRGRKKTTPRKPRSKKDDDAGDA